MIVWSWRASDLNRVFESLYGEVRAVTGMNIHATHVFVEREPIDTDQIEQNIDDAAAALAEHRRRNL